MSSSASGKRHRESGDATLRELRDYCDAVLTEHIVLEEEEEEAEKEDADEEAGFVLRARGVVPVATLRELSRHRGRLVRDVTVDAAAGFVRVRVHFEPDAALRSSMKALREARERAMQTAFVRVIPADGEVLTPRASQAATVLVRALPTRGHYVDYSGRRDGSFDLTAAIEARTTVEALAALEREFAHTVSVFAADSVLRVWVQVRAAREFAPAPAPAVA